jgi:hypothetical protein
MTYREARSGAVIAGAILFTMPVAEILLGMGVAGPVHFIVGTLGAALIAAGLSGRIL